MKRGQKITIIIGRYSSILVFINLAIFRSTMCDLIFRSFMISIIHKLHIVLSLIHSQYTRTQIELHVWLKRSAYYYCQMYNVMYLEQQRTLKTQYPVKHSSSCRKTAMSDSTSWSTNVEYLLGNVQNTSVCTCTYCISMWCSLSTLADFLTLKCAQ